MIEQLNKYTAGGALLAALLLTATNATANTGEAHTADSPTTSAGTSSLMLPFGDQSLNTSNSRLTWLDERLEAQVDLRELHHDSRMRQRDDTGAHNDFLLEHSGNLLHVRFPQ